MKFTLLYIQLLIRILWPLLIAGTLAVISIGLTGCQTTGAVAPTPTGKIKVPAQFGKDFIIQDFPTADGSMVCYVLTLPGPIPAGLSCIALPGT